MAKEDEIKLIAYNIWLEEGCCDGRDLEHWVRAEIIWEEQAKQGKKSGPAKEAAVKEKPGAAKAAKPTQVKKPTTQTKVRREKAVKQAEKTEPKPVENKATA